MRKTLAILALSALTGCASAGEFAEGFVAGLQADAVTESESADWPCPGYYNKSSRDGNNNYQTSCSGSEIMVRGSNYTTSSFWTTYLSANGDMRGTDAKYRSWQYTEATGYYWRSDGKTCFGKTYRQCLGGN